MFIYYVEGELRVNIEEEYIDFLKLGSEYLLNNLKISFSENKILIKGKWNRRKYLEDFLKFIEIYATKKDGMIRLFLHSKHHEDVCFYFDNGTLFQSHFLDYSSQSNIDIDYLVKKLTKLKLETYYIIEKNNQNELQTKEKINDQLYLLKSTKNKKNIMSILNNIYRLTDNHRFHICFYFSNEKICWDTSQGEMCSKLLFLSKKEEVSDEIIDKKFFTLGKYNIHEKRKIIIHNKVFPLSESLMYFCYHFDIDKRNVIYPDNTASFPCYECMYRLRKLSGGCGECTPRIIR